MKRLMIWMLLAALLLSGCAAGKTYTPDAVANTAAGTQATIVPEESAAVETTEPTTEPTTVPTEPEIFRNPLNGEILEEPFTGRIFANTVSNMQENMPHVGINHADMVIETYVNMNNVVRCLALFTDIESVEAVGSTRSTRPVFNDIAQHYALVLSHAGGSDTALEDAASRGIDHFNIDSWEVSKTGASYRDKEYKRSYENSLLGIGSGIKAYAESIGIPMELEKDYGFRFSENGMPEDGEAADIISLTMVYGRAKKDTVMAYNRELGKYVWNQYGKEMREQITDELEAFNNVIIMQANVTNQGIYHQVDFTAGGIGYYANGGKLIPIVWACDDENSAFRFMTNDAEPLEMGVGNTYIAIVTPESPIAWEAVELPEETMPETIAETISETSAE